VLFENLCSRVIRLALQSVSHDICHRCHTSREKQ